MRNLALVCASVATVASIVSVNLWRELRAERELTVGLRAELAEATARAPAPGQFPSWSGPAAASIPGGSASFGPGSAAASAAGAVRSALEAARDGGSSPNGSAYAGANANAVASGNASTSTNASGNATATPNASINTLVLNERELLNDPEYRQARLAQTRLMLSQNYPGLAEELGLSADETSKIFDLLATHQLDMTSAAIFQGAEQMDQAMMQERSRMQAEMRQRQQGEIMALLGSRYPQYEQYQQSQPARSQVTQLGRALESTGQPLTAEQSRPLIAALTAEQQRTRQEAVNMANTFRNINPNDAQAQQRLQEESFRMQVERDRRLLETASAHLSSAQLETYRTMLDSQLAMSRASMRAQQVQRAQMQAQGQSLPASAPVMITSF